MKHSEFYLLADYIYDNFGIKISENKMNIFEVKDGCPLKGKTEQMTEEELQREYDFHIAESIIANLYKEGKITADELHKISALNRQKFSPRLAEIMS